MAMQGQQELLTAAKEKRYKDAAALAEKVLELEPNNVVVQGVFKLLKEKVQLDDSKGETNENVHGGNTLNQADSEGHTTVSATSDSQDDSDASSSSSSSDVESGELNPQRAQQQRRCDSLLMERTAGKTTFGGVERANMRARLASDVKALKAEELLSSVQAKLSSDPLL